MMSPSRPLCQQRAHCQSAQVSPPSVAVPYHTLCPQLATTTVALRWKNDIQQLLLLSDHYSSGKHMDQLLQIIDNSTMFYVVYLEQGHHRFGKLHCTTPSYHHMTKISTLNEYQEFQVCVVVARGLRRSKKKVHVIQPF